MDEFLTVAEVAEILKLNQQTVRNWIFSTGADVSP
jgi:helix-turn-helix protein